MFISRRFLLLCVLLGALMLIGLWVALPHQAQAHTLLETETSQTASPAPVSVAQPAAGEGEQSAPFLDFLRRLEAGSQTNRPAANMTLNLDVGTGSMAGRVPTPLPVTVTLQRTSGTPVSARLMPFPDSGGYWYFLSFRDFFSLGWPRPGDVLFVEQGGQAISLTVPTLSAGLFAHQDVLRGEAPAGAALTAYLFPFDNPTAWYTATATAQPDGAYTITWTARADIRPRDSGYLRYSVASNRHVYRAFIAPFLRLQSGGWMVDGQTLPNDWIDADYRYGGADGLGHFSLDFDYMLYYYGKIGMPPPFQRGDVYSLTLADGIPVSTTVQALSAQATSHGVSGVTVPGAQVEIVLLQGPMSLGSNTWDAPPVQRLRVTADAAGVYSASLPLETGNYGYVLLDNPDGHQTFAWFARPYALFTLGWTRRAETSLASGQVSDNTPLTVSVRGPSGYVKTTYRAGTRSNGYFPPFRSYYGWYGGGTGIDGTQLALESGDRVTITQQGQGTLLSAEMPSLTLKIDHAANLLYGKAPAGAHLTVQTYVDHNDDPLTVPVTASLTGTYQLSLSTFGGYDAWTNFEVIWQSGDGYAVRRVLSAYGGDSCLPRMGRVEVGGNTVFWYNFSGTSCNAPLAVSLRDADGNLKATIGTYLSVDNVGFFTHDKIQSPIPIQGGDTIVFEYDGESESWQVPPLDIHLDVAGRQVTGTAPADLPVNVNVRQPFSLDGNFHSLSTVLTPTASGVFTLPLTFTPTAGTTAYARLNIGGAEFITRDALPWMEVDLVHLQAGGILPPLTPYTLTHCTGTTCTQETADYANEVGEWGASLQSAPSVGDVYSLTLPSGTLTLSVPTLTALLDARTASVSGQAPAGARLQVQLSCRKFDYLPWAPPPIVTTGDANGTYQVAFPTLAGCELLDGAVSYLAPSGATARLDFTAPYWEVTLGSQKVQAVAPSPGGKVQVAWYAASGEVYSDVLTASTAYGQMYLYLPESVQSGDRLVMTDTRGVVVSYTVPQMSAEHDYARQVLVGTAPPNSSVEVVFGRGYGFYDVRRQTRVDAGGYFGVDTSDLHLLLGYNGYVTVYDRHGNRTHLYFPITGYRLWMPLVTR